MLTTMVTCGFRLVQLVKSQQQQKKPVKSLMIE